MLENWNVVILKRSAINQCGYIIYNHLSMVSLRVTCALYLLCLVSISVLLLSYFPPCSCYPQSHIVKQHIRLPLTGSSVQCTNLFTCVQIPQLYMTVQTARCCHCLQQIKLKISMTIMSLWYQATIIIIYRYFIEMRCIVWSKWVSFPLLWKTWKIFHGLELQITWESTTLNTFR